MKSFFSQLSGCLLLVVFLVSPGFAGQTLDIYKATTLVKNQSEAERNRAARETLGEVVVRVSGQLAALDNPQVRATINQAQNYLFGFSYNSTQATLMEGDKVFPAIELQLNYSPQAIEQLLRKAGLPFWPAQRPTVLVWPVINDSTGTRLELSPEILTSLKQRAAWRGVPLVFPRGDIQDYVALPASTLWQFNSGQIHAASMRYKADAILVARFTPVAQGRIPPANYDVTAESFSTAGIAPVMPVATAPSTSSSGEPPVVQPGPWLGDWQLLRGNEHQGYASETPELGGLLMQLADDLADAFARQYAITPNSLGAQTFYVHVGRVADFGAFKQSQAYLGGLAMVKKMEVVKVDADGLLVGVTTEGDLKLLVTTLALGKKLQPVDPAVVARVLSQVTASSAVVTEAEEAALAAALDAEIAMARSANTLSPTASHSTPVSSVGTATNPLRYLWLQ